MEATLKDKKHTDRKKCMGCTAYQFGICWAEQCLRDDLYNSEPQVVPA